MYFSALLTSARIGVVNMRHRAESIPKLFSIIRRPRGWRYLFAKGRIDQNLSGKMSSSSK